LTRVGQYPLADGVGEQDLRSDIPVEGGNEPKACDNRGCLGLTIVSRSPTAMFHVKRGGHEVWAFKLLGEPASCASVIWMRSQ
jgi:hypothetical protein